MKKIGLLSLALVLALGTLGIGYATWSDNVTVTEEIYSGDMCVTFTYCNVNDSGNDPTLGDLGCMNTHNITMCDPDDPYTLAGIFAECLLEKDVGSSNCTTVDRDQDGWLEVIVVDAYEIYPSYYGIVNYGICNCGKIPWMIDRIDVVVNDTTVHTFHKDWCKAINIDGEGGPDLEVWWGDNFGKQIDENQCKDMSFHWHLLQEAPQVKS
jgi:hypothetical protein